MERAFWQYFVRTNEHGTEEVMYARVLGMIGGLAGYVTSESPMGETVLSPYRLAAIRNATPDEVRSALEQAPASHIKVQLNDAKLGRKIALQGCRDEEKELAKQARLEQRDREREAKRLVKQGKK